MIDKADLGVMMRVGSGVQQHLCNAHSSFLARATQRCGVKLYKQKTASTANRTKYIKY